MFAGRTIIELLTLIEFNDPLIDDTEMSKKKRKP